MAKISATSIAIKWHFFTYISGVNIYLEYFNLFMKQLGFNPVQIGFTTLLGFPNLLIPLYLLFGEKFRARKTVLAVVVVGLSVCCVLPPLSLIVPALQPRCVSENSTNSMDATKQLAVVRNTTYGNDTNNLERSVIPSANEIIRTSRPGPSTPSFLQKSQERMNVVIRTNYARKQASGSRRQNSLNYSTTNNNVRNTSSQPSNFRNSTQSSGIHRSQPWLSALFLMLVLSRSQMIVFYCTDLALTNLATIAYLKEEKANYGSYWLWGHVGTALSISSVALLAWLIRIPICGVEKSGYFLAFIWGFVITLLSLPSLHWFKFEYNEKKSFNWSGVKSDVFNAHYIFMFAVLFYTGLCVSFQMYWEFWYLNGLSASPLLLGGAVLIRRPLVALSTFASSYLMRKIGELNTVCFALFLYSSSFLALSFTRIAWLVLAVDTFQAAAHGIGYCAFTVLFYKASSIENSSIILGIQETVFAVGYEGGATLMGVLFHALGTQLTLLLYSTSCAAVLVTLLLYICFSKYDHGYHKLPQNSDKK